MRIIWARIWKRSSKRVAMMNGDQMYCCSLLWWNLIMAWTTGMS